MRCYTILPGMPPMEVPIMRSVLVMFLFLLLCVLASACTKQAANADASSEVEVASDSVGAPEDASPTAAMPEDVTPAGK